MRFLIAAFLLAHGVAHLVGFAGTWRLSPTIPYHTTLLAGRVDVGDAGIRTTGVLWLMLACAFSLAAAGTMLDAPWWRMLVLVAAMASLTLSIAALPEAKVGVAINVAILTVLITGARMGWPAFST
jgi:hypothetical protein